MPGNDIMHHMTIPPHYEKVAIDVVKEENAIFNVPIPWCTCLFLKIIPWAHM